MSRHLDPSYFKLSDDGWLDPFGKTSERIAQRHTRLFQKKNDWQSLIKLESDLANAEQCDREPKSERGDKSWDSPSLKRR